MSLRPGGRISGFGTGQAAEQGHRVADGHGPEELRVGLLDGRARPWGQFGAGVGDAQPLGPGVGRVDLTLDEPFRSRARRTWEVILTSVPAWRATAS
ncbi:hypothetical protein ACFCYH_01315 [Streptomyces sp. NPDC056400]|uniref:hypothetical protein n=1 Tax=Streptomyces sp. NPDC056400 TaxID=3345808 RepID=UPI0035E11617